MESNLDVTSFLTKQLGNKIFLIDTFRDCLKDGMIVTKEKISNG